MNKYNKGDLVQYTSSAQRGSGKHKLSADLIGVVLGQVQYATPYVTYRVFFLGINRNFDIYYCDLTKISKESNY